MKIRSSHCERLRAVLTLVFLAGLQLDAFTARTDGGFVVYPGAQAGPVLFSHIAHGKEAGYPCSQCHGAGSVRALQITMEDIRDGKACGSCHSGRTTESRGRHVASPIEDCGNCHMPAADIIFKLNRMDPVKFSHVKHLSVDLGKKVSNPTGFSCADCHPTPFDRLSKESFRMAVPHENGGCARCHNGRKRNGGLPPAFAATTRCLTCHKPTSSDMRP